MNDRNQGSGTYGAGGKNRNTRNNYVISKKVGMVNPYTFVPIDRSKVFREDAEAYYSQHPLRTGVMHCSLITKTPLAVPEAEPENPGDEHKKYLFYREDEKAAIPGSSLRGMLRSVYETLTQSCFSTIRDNSYLSRRVERNDAYAPGILKREKGVYRLYKAKRCLVPYRKGRNDEILFKEKLDREGRRYIEADGKCFYSGDIVYFAMEKDGRVDKVTSMGLDNKNRRKQRGYLFIGEPIGTKRSESIFFVPEPERPIMGLDSKVLEAAYQKLLYTWEIYNDAAINHNLKQSSEQKDHHGYAGMKELDLEKGVPLWFKKKQDEDYVNFSYASIGRVAYNHSLNDLIGQEYRCTKRQMICEACKLFGMISGNGEEGGGLGSRIRVTTAHANGEVQFAYHPLKELASPHNSYLPFYAKSVNGKVPQSHDDRNAEIAGRKYYWHNIAARSDQRAYRAYEKNVRNVTMELVNPGTVFTFDIYYDGITKEQWDKLLWAITLGDNDRDSEMCHKLGHGKPIGLGSVKIVVDACEERTFTEEGYVIRSVPVPSKEEVPNFDCDALQALEKILDMRGPLQGDNLERPKECRIEYPNIVDKNEQRIESGKNVKGCERYQWYSQYKKNNENRDGNAFPLPKATDERQWLMAYKNVNYDENA